MDPVLQLPYAYEATIRRHRSRKFSDTHVVRGTTTVRLRAITSEDAPIAFTVSRLARREEPYVIPYRVHEGRLFVPLSDNPEFTAADLQQACGDSDLWRPLTSHRRPIPFDPSNYPVLPPLVGSREVPLFWRRTLEGQMAFLGATPRDLIGTRSRECEGEAQDFLQRNLLVIDGRVWSTERAIEPHFRVTCSTAVTVDLVLNPEPLFYTHGFRVDGLEKALAFAEDQRAAGQLLSVAITPDRVDIAIPETVMRDDVVMNAQTALAAITKRQNEPDYWPWPAEAHDLHTRLLATKQVPSLTADQAADALIDVCRFAHLFEGQQPNDLSDVAQLLAHTEGARRRWEMFELPARPHLSISMAETAADFAGYGGMRL